MTKEIVLKDPQHLTIHPFAKLMPEWSRDDVQFLSLVEDIRDRDIDQPLIIDTEDRILDGRARWRGARQLQHTEVPCIVRPLRDAAGVVLNSLLQRRHFTKGALAYLSFPLMEDGYEEIRRKRLEILKNPNKQQSSTQWTIVKTVEEFACGLGFSRPLFYQAREIHSLFKKTPALKADFEPRILAGEIGLGACLAGIAGQLATKDKPKGNSQQLDLFQDAFHVMTNRFAYWQKFDAGQKRALVPLICETAAKMPADLRDEWAKALRVAAKGEAV